MILVNRRADSTVKAMEDSPFHFYLTGSRFFGGVTPSSDWDYFVEDTSAVRLFLQQLGFYEGDYVAKHYDDSTIVTLFIRNDIQVQLVRNAVLKARAQDMLSKFVNMVQIPKENRKSLWNLALGCLRKIS